MRKLLNKPWFVALLAIAALVLVAGSVLDMGGSRPVIPDRAQGPDEYEEEEAAGEMQRSGTLQEALRLVEMPSQFSDPFASRGSRTGGDAPNPDEPVEPDVSETVRVSAIWSQAGEVLVLVNNRIHRAGDTIGRLTIESAARDGVWFTHWKGRDFVSVGQEFTLTTSAREAAKLNTAHHEG